jgi:hypothetical protein
MYISCFIKQRERVHCGVWAYSVREGVGPKKVSVGENSRLSETMTAGAE